LLFATLQGAASIHLGCFSMCVYIHTHGAVCLCICVCRDMYICIKAVCKQYYRRIGMRNQAWSCRLQGMEQKLTGFISLRREQLGSTSSPFTFTLSKVRGAPKTQHMLRAPTWMESLQGTFVPAEIWAGGCYPTALWEGNLPHTGKGWRKQGDALQHRQIEASSSSGRSCTYIHYIENL